MDVCEFDFDIIVVLDKTRAVDRLADQVCVRSGNVQQSLVHPCQITPAKKGKHDSTPCALHGMRAVWGRMSSGTPPC
jgi:hypothetical protein